MRLPFFSCLFLSILTTVALGCAALGCNEASLINAPDAGNPCLAPVLEFGCHPQAAALPGCPPDLHPGGPPMQQEEVLDGGSFPVGCTVIVYSKTPDQNRQCSVIGTCNCGGDDAGNYNWTCHI